MATIGNERRNSVCMRFFPRESGECTVTGAARKAVEPMQALRAIGQADRRCSNAYSSIESE